MAPATPPSAEGVPPAAPAATLTPVPVPLATPEPPPPPVAAPDPTARRHDGLYLRLGLGVGYTVAGVEPAMGDLSAKGGGAAFEFALGGTVYDGLVIGGGIYFVSTGTVHWKGDAVRNFSESDTLEGGNGGMSLLGVVIDYYPNPKDGFHVQAGLGIGAMNYQKHETSLPAEVWAGGGGGFMLGAGYEAWVGSQWSLGGIARILGTTASLQGEDTHEKFDGRGIAPALLFVATHH